MDARAMAQRYRQRKVVWFPGLGNWLRIYVVGQQPRKPSDAVVERSRSAIRRAKSFICGMKNPAPFGPRHHCRSGRPIHTRSDTGTATRSLNIMSHGIEQELTTVRAARCSGEDLASAPAQPNTRKRKLTVTNYNELVLGFDRSRTVPFIVTEADVENGCIRARNRYNNEFAGRVAFFATRPAR